MRCDDTFEMTADTTFGLPGAEHFAELGPGQWIMQESWDNLAPVDKGWVGERLAARGLGLQLASDPVWGRHFVVVGQRLTVESALYRHFESHEELTADQKAFVLSMAARHAAKFVDDFTGRHFVRCMMEEAIGAVMVKLCLDVCKAAIDNARGTPRHLLRVG